MKSVAGLQARAQDAQPEVHGAAAAAAGGDGAAGTAPLGAGNMQQLRSEEMLDMLPSNPYNNAALQVWPCLSCAFGLCW